MEYKRSVSFGVARKQNSLSGLLSNMITRPLKAPSKPLTEAQIAGLQYPYLVSDKKDGIRCLIHPTLGPVSQKMLPIPNHYIRETLASLGPWAHYLDGELLIPGFSFNDNQSVIMSRMHPRQKEFRFMVFDDFETPLYIYEVRSKLAQSMVASLRSEYVEWLPHNYVHSREQLDAYEENAVYRGEEGIMLNRPDGWYKQGRSTYREGLLLKIVRHTRDEAVIIGFEEGLENCNAATVDGNGLTKRSKHSENMRRNGSLGTLICKWKGKRLRVGSGEGLTHALRQHIWQNQACYLNKTITIKYKEFGMLDLPRQPIFCGFRND